MHQSWNVQGVSATVRVSEPCLNISSLSLSLINIYYNIFERQYNFGFKNEKKVKALFFALHEESGHKSSQTPTALLNCAKFHCAICEAQIPF